MEALWVLNAPQNVWFMLLCYGPFSCTRLLLCSSADTEMKGSAVHQPGFVTSHGHHSPDVPLDARSMEQGSSTIQIQSFQTNTTSFAITGRSLSKARCGESSSMSITRTVACWTSVLKHIGQMSPGQKIPVTYYNPDLQFSVPSLLTDPLCICHTATMIED